MSEPMLHLDVHVERRGVEVSFDVARGETVALLGPNGSGKSTVLSVVAGILRPDEGEVVLDGRVLSRNGRGRRPVHVPPHDRDVALLAQDPLLFPHLSSLENVAFGPRAHGRGRRAARTQARAWLSRLDVEPLAARKPHTLSGGQAQRVALARALAVEPGLLLLDEPMAALDADVLPGLRRTLRAVLEGLTTVLVTHDVLDALLLSQRVVVVEGGRVVESGPTRDVLGHPRSAFASTMAGLNLLTGSWDGVQVRLADGSGVTGMTGESLPAVGSAVCAAFRPSAVSVYRDPPQGSPRNALRVRVSDLDVLGDLVRVRAGDLSADVTPASVADLDLVPGHQVTFSVKAAEVMVYPL